MAALSHLAVQKGSEAAVLNREVIPYLRDVGERLAVVIAFLAEQFPVLVQIAENTTPPAFPALGSAVGIGTGASVNFPSKVIKRGIEITNLSTINDLLISLETPAAGSSDTYSLRPGTRSPFLPCTNPSMFNLRSAAGVISACYAGY